jgi:hypothetical protein
MDYLVYIAFDAENLQFFLWYQNYLQRFNLLEEDHKAFSPPVNIALNIEQGKTSDDKTSASADTAKFKETSLSRHTS